MVALVGAFWMVTLQVALRPPEVLAVMVALPFLRAVSAPVSASTARYLGLLEVQVSPLAGATLPSWKVSMASSASACSSTPMLNLSGRVSFLALGVTVTTQGASAATPLCVLALTQAMPFRTAVMTPVEAFTVTQPGSGELLSM